MQGLESSFSHHKYFGAINKEKGKSLNGDLPNNVFERSIQIVPPL
jgi:hypothetical protein